MREGPPSTSTSSATTNTEKNSSQNREVECVTSGMMVGERLSEELNTEEIRIEKCNEDANSSSSKNSDDEDDYQSEVGREIIASEESAGSFGNIVVKNSYDVHFGNNTYYQYQGPVVIKQFVYKSEISDRKFAIENGGKDNLNFEPDTVIQTDEELSKTDQNQDVQNEVTEDQKNNIESSQGINWLNKLYKKRKLLAICLSIVFIIILIIIFVNKKKEDILSQWWEESNQSGQLKIISRDEWSAESPKAKYALNLPVPNVIISDTASYSCTNRAQCTQYVRYLQFFHMNDKKWSDIAYNFIIGGDGYVYEGRGWNYLGSHSYGSHIGWNAKSIGISFIGNFVEILPPEHQILAAKLLIEKGVKEKYVAQDYKLYTFRQVVANKTSPGQALYENIKTWPNWANESYV